MKLPIKSYINCFENERKRIKIRGGFTLPDGRLMVLTTKNSDNAAPVKKTGKYFVQPSFATFPTGTPVLVGENISGYVMVDENLINFLSTPSIFMKKIHLAALQMAMFDPEAIGALYPTITLPRLGSEEETDQQRVENFLSLAQKATDAKQISALKGRAEKFNSDVIAALKEEVDQIAGSFNLKVDYTPSFDEALEVLTLKAKSQQEFENHIISLIDQAEKEEEVKKEEEKEEVTAEKEGEEKDEKEEEEKDENEEETKEEEVTGETKEEEMKGDEKEEEEKEETEENLPVSVSAKPSSPLVDALTAIASSVAQTAQYNVKTAELLAQTAGIQERLANKLFGTNSETAPAAPTDAVEIS